MQKRVGYGAAVTTPAAGDDLERKFQLLRSVGEECHVTVSECFKVMVVNDMLRDW